MPLSALLFSLALPLVRPSPSDPSFLRPSHAQRWEVVLGAGGLPAGALNVTFKSLWAAEECLSSMALAIIWLCLLLVAQINEMAQA